MAQVVSLSLGTVSWDGQKRRVIVPGKTGASLGHSLQRSTENPFLYPHPHPLHPGCRAATIPIRKAQPPLSGPAGLGECAGRPLQPILNGFEPAEKWLDSGVTLKGICSTQPGGDWYFYPLSSTLYLDTIKSIKGQGEREEIDFKFNLETNCSILPHPHPEMAKKILDFK